LSINFFIVSVASSGIFSSMNNGDSEGASMKLTVGDAQVFWGNE
jgi:hypothetical protein